MVIYFNFVTCDPCAVAGELDEPTVTRSYHRSQVTGHEIHRSRVTIHTEEYSIMPLDEIDMSHVGFQGDTDKMAQTMGWVPDIVEEAHTLVDRGISHRTVKDICRQSEMQGETMVGGLVCTRYCSVEWQWIGVMVIGDEFVVTVVVCHLDIETYGTFGRESVEGSQAGGVGIVILLCGTRETRHDDARSVGSEKVEVA